MPTSALTPGLQQHAGHLPWCHRYMFKVCIIDQTALIRIALSVSELTGLGARWGLTPSGCNLPYSRNLFFLFPEYPPTVWDLLGWSDRQCQLLTSQPVLDTHRRGQPHFPGCWHHLLSSPFLPYLAQFTVWFYLWRHLCVYNHNQLLHLSPTGMLPPLSCHLAGNRHILTTAAVSIIALIFLLFSPNVWTQLHSSFSKPCPTLPHPTLVVLLPQTGSPSPKESQNCLYWKGPKDHLVPTPLLCSGKLPPDQVVKVPFSLTLNIFRDWAICNFPGQACSRVLPLS